MPITTVSGNHTGTASGEIIVVEGTTPITVNGDGGNDLLLGTAGPVLVDSTNANNGIATAIDLSAASWWTTAANPLLADGTVPHATIVGIGTGEVNYYAVTLEAGQTITIDVDIADSGIGSNQTGFDTLVHLLGPDGSFIGAADDSGNTEGGLGSVGFRDAFGTFTAPTAGVYYIVLGDWGPGTPAGVPPGASLMLHLSVPGHATSAAPAEPGRTLRGGDGIDHVYGGTGNDLLYGDAGNDTLVGGAGNDFLDGGATANLISATVFDYNVLQGGEGNDTLVVRQAENFIDGGAGTDTLNLTNLGSGVALSLAQTGLQSAGGWSIQITSVETVIGTAQADWLTGNAADNILIGGTGNDTLSGAGGNDTFYIGLGDGSDTIDGGAGSDTLGLAGSGWAVNLRSGVGTASGSTLSLRGIERVLGSVGADTIIGDDRTTLIQADEGDDYVQIGIGSTTAYGGAGADTIDVRDLEELGNAIIDLDLGHTTVGDRVLTLAEFEHVRAGAGDDLIIASAAANLIDGGEGNDTVSYVNAADGVVVDLVQGTREGAAGDGLSNVENLIGSAFDDALAGNNAANHLDGGAGDDLIQGFRGDDVIYWRAGGGSDDMVGGDGVDTLDLTGSDVAWTVDIAANSAANAAGDTLILLTLENVRGSQLADVIHAGGVPGTYEGMGGDDIIHAVALGGNRYDGGAGTDTFDWTGAPSGQILSINLVTGLTSSGDVLTGFENIVTDDTGDDITGSAGDNHISTGALSDVVRAGGGSDDVRGGTGDDVLDGGTGNDWLSGDDGHDELDGGTGADWLYGGDGNDRFHVDNAGDVVLEDEVGSPGTELEFAL